jgi:hypothetical protein
MWGQPPSAVRRAKLDRLFFKSAECEQAQSFSTLTPFQNATYPLIFFAAAFGSG